ncbi:molybdopterin-guanine dinucleotide biosynthesis protein B [Sediminicurvatus halobius]|uniref:Molybdopterin-guanine dinucleotide biosynthesis protein B n=1 Tax=Sediminicurvatus halobius TaxID=2182432 RepID=A0A2U2MWV5_9GAMM|nr:molybdopterin-guanine dinucleotide biosynthesis protein B [Spiribacter halobius]PWG61314.1 molybdopterin-guanine dinucleotide biosynthesis protein B [Spiribacter halobius]UEX79691.1 molybdopterin-guanine dinucleotide biosynthesis protein B [Spiribacter halobius]
MTAQPASAAQPAPVLGIAGWSGAGKTTLLAAVIPRLTAAGLRVALVKHAHHRFDVDHPGKDSHRLREAGAREVLITSARRHVRIVERAEPRDPVLEEELARVDRQRNDLVLVEGFRHAPIPKLEVWRAARGEPPLYPGDAHILAVVTDSPEQVDTRLPVLALDQPESVAAFIRRWLEEVRQPRAPQNE